MIDIGEPTLNLPGFCIEKWPENQERLVYGVLCFVFVYAIPGSVVVLAYSLMGLRLCAISPPFDGPGNEGMASTRQVMYFPSLQCRNLLLLRLLRWENVTLNLFAKSCILPGIVTFRFGGYL
jgi:hypothetical protein